jgi:hypothetical protein
MIPRKLEAWATAHGQQIVALMILCRRHSDELRAELVELRARLKPMDRTLFRVRHRAFLREVVDTSPGCGQCATERGNAAIYEVDGFKLIRDELAAEGATA